MNQPLTDHQLAARYERLADTAAHALHALGYLIEDHSDPGADALGAQYNLRQELLWHTMRKESAEAVDAAAQHERRKAVAAEFARLDAHDWGYDHGFCDEYGTDPETDAFVDAALAVVQPELDRLRAENAELATELGARDEKARKRWIKKQEKQLSIRFADFRAGHWEMDLAMGREMAAAYVAMAKTMLGDGPNYSETKLEFDVKVAESPELYTLVVQRHAPGALTPHEARQRAEAECSRLRAELEQTRQQADRWKRRARHAEGAVRHTLWVRPATYPKPETATEVIDRLHGHIRHTYPDLVTRNEHQPVEVYQWADSCKCEDSGSDDYEADHEETDGNGEAICSRTFLGKVCDSCKDEDGDGPTWSPESVEWPCPPIAELNTLTDVGVLAAAMGNPAARPSA